MSPLCPHYQIDKACTEEILTIDEEKLPKNYTNTAEKSVWCENKSMIMHAIS